jgi:hypothetical protein
MENAEVYLCRVAHPETQSQKVVAGGEAKMEGK